MAVITQKIMGDNNALKVPPQTYGVEALNGRDVWCVVTKFDAEESQCMTHVVTENCIRCKYTDCVVICPVDCFHEAEEFLVIDPDVCIDCALCITECEADAIFGVNNVPDDQREFIEINQRLAASLPVITAKRSPLPDADAWNGQPGKISFLKDQ